MNAKRTIVILSIIAAVALIVLASVGVPVPDVHETPEGVYVEAGSSIRASPHTSVSNGHVTLRVNGVEDASSRAMSDAWVKLGLTVDETYKNQSGRFYNHTLVPPDGDRYLIANVTVANAKQQATPFTYTDFYLVGSDGRTYYANYAMCGAECTTSVLRNHAASAKSASDLYVLFSMPATVNAVKLVYSSRPPIVVTL